MKLSSQQEKALDAVGRWLRNHRQESPYFMLAGYAGTGKTTIARRLAESASGLVYYAAYTGKAAHVLRKTGIENVSTIHQLIYTPRDKCDEHLSSLRSRRLRLLDQKPLPQDELNDLDDAIAREITNLRRPEFFLNTASPLMNASLIVIDEYSMVDEQTGRDLLSFGCPVLALGDPGQLPPVQGRRFFARSPDALLTQIHRQASENPIIQMSMEVREGRSLKPGQYGTSKVVRRGSMSNAAVGRVIQESDQLLVGTNNTRFQFNHQIRKMYGRTTPNPEAGDKLVCLRNNHQEGLLNGQTFTVARVSPRGPFLELRLVGEDGERKSCISHHFGPGTPLTPAEAKQANEFDFGYALTVHKAQGSQWDKVAIVDEWHFKDRDKWLYTAITRAAESVTIMM
jgi:exodeoxyribonuclease V